MGPEPRCGESSLDEHASGHAEPPRASVPARRRRRLLAGLAAFVALFCASNASTAAAKHSGHPETITRGKGRIVFSCTGVTFEYTDFPDASENHVHERVSLNGVLFYNEEFSFNGTSATNTVVPPKQLVGNVRLTAGAKWNKSNGASGETDLKRDAIDCTAKTEKHFVVEKTQSIAESGLPFVETPITNARVGQTVDYEIVVRNTGTVPLKVITFTDPKCDPGTIKGGPGEATLAPEASTVYTCSHKLTQGGAYTNVASVTATDAEGGGSATENSNEVVTDVTEKPRFEVEKLQEVLGTNTGYTTAQLSAAVGQTVDYEIVVKNGGNVAVSLTEFSDVFCDAGTIAGGPTGPLAPGATAVYKCSHRVTEANLAENKAIYYNVASVTGVAGSWSDTEATNMVVVKVTAAAVTPPQSQTAPSPGSSSGSSGVLSSQSSATPTKKKAKRKTKPRVHRTSVSHREPKFTG